MKAVLQNLYYNIIKRNRFKYLIEKDFPIGERFKFIQVGANDGIKFDDLYDFVTSRKSKGLVIEPLTIYYEKLARNYKPYPDIKPIKAAVHKTKKEATIHYVKPDKLYHLPEWAEGIGSLNPSHHQELKIPTDYMDREKVPCIHLMDLIRQYNFFDIDMLQIDTEGYDPEVLKMIDFNLIKPKYIKYEHFVLKSDEQQFVLDLLTSQGYRILRGKEDNIAILGGE